MKTSASIKISTSIMMVRVILALVVAALLIVFLGAIVETSSEAALLYLTVFFSWFVPRLFSNFLL